MRELWLRAWRRTVPASWRLSAFDPTVADLRRDWVHQHGQAGSRATRGLLGVKLAFAIAVAALECRWLAARERLVAAAHTPLKEGRPLMLWSTLARACKIFSRQPALAAVVVLTLGVGIGANLSVFSILNEFLLAPIPVPRPHDLVRVSVSTAGRADVISYPDYRDLRDGAPDINLAAHAQPIARVGPPEAGELRTVELVTGNYFGMLGLTPLRGRLLEEADCQLEGQRPIAVLSAGYWRSHYAAGDSAIGQTVLINNTSFEIVGVAPEHYSGTQNGRLVDLWAPITMQNEVRPRGLSIERRGWGWLSVVGRLRPNATMASAQGQIDAVAAELGRRFPPTAGSSIGAMKYSVRPASPMSDQDWATLGPALAVAFAFTVLLLIVTCANLAGVMQARIVGRRRDIAIRKSLGASRVRVSGEWLAESLVLALAGGAAGLGAALAVGAWFASIRLPVDLVGSLTVRPELDWRIVAYAFGLSVVTGILFGVVPAARAAGEAPMTLLKDEGGALASGRAGTRLRRALVLVQVAVSVVLLVASALLATSLRHQRTFDPGFSTDRLGLLTFDLRRQGVPKADWSSAITRIVDRLRQQSGVTQADVTTIVPLAPGSDRLGVRIPGYVAPNGKANVSIDFGNVGSRFFDVLGVPFTRGGPWVPGGATPVVVVNDAMARRFWPDGDPVGKAIHVIDQGDVTVVGVVRDIAYHQPGEAPTPFVFFPADALPPPTFDVMVRTSTDPAPMLRGLTQAVATVDRRFAPSEWMTFEEGRAAVLFPMRMLAGAAVAFGAIAILLTAVGLYGVVSTTVGQRTREIGIRMALGARSVTVLGGVLREALVIAGAGAAIGLVAGYWSAGPLRGWLFGVGRFDPAVYAGVAGVTVAITLIAAAVPARRAAKVDPVIALRH